MTKSYSYNWNAIAGFAQVVEAKNKKEAIQIVKERFGGKLPAGFDI